MASLHTLEQRLRTVEARLAEIEGGYGDTIYKLHRDVVLGAEPAATVSRLVEQALARIDDAADADLLTTAVGGMRLDSSIHHSPSSRTSGGFTARSRESVGSSGDGPGVAGVHFA